MLITEKKVYQLFNQLTIECEQLRKRIDALNDDYVLLLKHLNLDEVRIPQKKVFIDKGPSLEYLN